MRHLFKAALGAGLLFTASNASAQSNDLKQLEDGSWPLITIGQTVQGTLTTSDFRRHDNTFTDAFFYDARAGETVTFTEHSGDFDSWLVLDDPNGDLYEYDDDSGGGSDARVTVTFPHDGRYLILANVVTPDATGGYTLSATRGGTTASSSSGSAGSSSGSTGGASYKDLEGMKWPLISTGQPMAGSLTPSDIKRDDGTYTDAFFYEAKEGETATITMRSSDVDSWLVLDDPNGTLYVHDDDSGGGRDAQIKVTFPHAGRYLIFANDVVPNSTGSYTLTISH